LLAGQGRTGLVGSGGARTASLHSRKVHPKVLIDDLKRRTEEQEKVRPKPNRLICSAIQRVAQHEAKTEFTGMTPTGRTG